MATEAHWIKSPMDANMCRVTIVNGKSVPVQSSGAVQIVTKDGNSEQTREVHLNDALLVN